MQGHGEDGLGLTGSPFAILLIAFSMEYLARRWIGWRKKKVECWLPAVWGNGGISGLKDILSPLRLIVLFDAAGPFRDVSYIYCRACHAHPVTEMMKVIQIASCPAPALAYFSSRV